MGGAGWARLRASAAAAAATAPSTCLPARLPAATSERGARPAGVRRERGVVSTEIEWELQFYGATTPTRCALCWVVACSLCSACPQAAWVAGRHAGRPGAAAARRSRWLAGHSQKRGGTTARGGAPPPEGGTTARGGHHRPGGAPPPGGGTTARGERHHRSGGGGPPLRSGWAWSRWPGQPP